MPTGPSLASPSCSRVGDKKDSEVNQYSSLVWQSTADSDEPLMQAAAGSM